MGHYKAEILELLRSKQIPFRELEHPPVFTVEEMVENRILEHGKVAKNLFLRNAKGDRHYLVCLPSDRQVDLKALSTQLGSTRLSFASEHRLTEYLGVTHGAVSPLGVLNDKTHTITVAVDRSILEWDAVGVHPNDNTATLWLAPEDLLHLLREWGNPLLVL